MVEVKPIDVCCSSEDPAFPAYNLVRGALKPSDERKQWLCSSPDEKSAHITLTYEKPFVISSLEIKNNGSAYVQVEGGLSGEPGRYQILWKSQNLMTPSESRMGTEADGTYIFLTQDLATSDKDKIWDTLKITCSQPFNKLKKYGLSHVVARSALPVKEESPSFPDIPTVKLEHDEDGNIINSYNSDKQQEKVSDHQTHMSSEVSSSGCNEFCGSLYTPVKQEPTAGYYSTPGRSSEPSSSDHDVGQSVSTIKWEDSLHVNASTLSGEETNSQEDTTVLTSPLRNNSCHSSPVKRRMSDSASGSDSDSDNIQIIKRPAPCTVIYKPFNKLLEGVQIVISGFPNPYRAEIRSRALQMGATYCPFWSDNSTHLICAFMNTPKHRQAAGDGLIVSRDWIDQCYLQRKRLPWRRFALSLSERSLVSGEVEIWELQPNSASTSSSQENAQSFTPPSSNTERETGSDFGCSGQSQNKSPSSSASQATQVKQEAPDHNMLDGVSRQFASQNTCILLSGNGVSVKTETNNEQQPFWEDNGDGLQTVNSPPVVSCPAEVHCSGAVEQVESRRPDATNVTRHPLLNSSPVVSSPMHCGARAEYEAMRSSHSSASQLETGTDGFAGYYRPISQPHSSSATTYLVPPVIMLPQTLPQYFVPVSQQMQAPLTPRNPYTGRSVPSNQIHGHHVQVRHSLNKTPRDSESPK